MNIAQALAIAAATYVMSLESPTAVLNQTFAKANAYALCALDGAGGEIATGLEAAAQTLAALASGRTHGVRFAH